MIATNNLLNPYQSLGLSRNPFIGEEQLNESEVLWIDRGWSRASTPQTKTFIQVIGDRGVGKTAHLKHWQSQTGGPYYYVQPGWQRFELPPINKIAYWDEVDRIPLPIFFIALLGAMLFGATIVVGTHTDRSKIATLFGFAEKKVELPPLDCDSLIAWANAKIDASQLPALDCSLRLSEEKAEEIIAIAQGSWRAAADYLHIWAAETAKGTRSIEGPENNSRYVVE